MCIIALFALLHYFESMKKPVDFGALDCVHIGKSYVGNIKLGVFSRALAFFQHWNACLFSAPLLSSAETKTVYYPYDFETADFTLRETARSRTVEYSWI